MDAGSKRAARRQRMLIDSAPSPRQCSPSRGNEIADPTSSDTDEHEGRVRFRIPPAPVWGPLPERRPRRVRIWPTLQERGPSPTRQESFDNGLGDHWPNDGWRFDRHPDYSGWNASASGHGAAMLMNAAYGAASAVSHNFTQVDFRWHTPDKHNVKPLGYNKRGDLAPRTVHAVLEPMLARRKIDPSLWPFAHKTMDLGWMLHSRAILRCPRFLEQLNFFTEAEIAQLAWAMREHMFDDGRLLILDPREEPIYGRTLDTPGDARLYRMFPFLRREQETATWDNDDGGASGSSDCSLTRPFERTPSQTIEHLNRHHQRRLRDAVAHAERVEGEIRRVEDEGMINIFDSGLNALAPSQSASWRTALGLRPATPEAVEESPWRVF
ncbi:hypothetical protein EXIGLDRAFT_775750 [Exidia glandulosa HHB12029]|uniref:Uncharacterized protein n=1 Tax=Exidia glandulosa HHB12029 TaxID=1314781 RepID=A0A165ZRN2_EXIGL|nr:hypothetical protein EXIGLDRAFT_775750 [Exidia glandulosa HHB12029]